jgi:hypothetical protein
VPILIVDGEAFRLVLGPQVDEKDLDSFNVVQGPIPGSNKDVNDLDIKVEVKESMIRLTFSTSVDTISLTPKTAIELASQLQKYALGLCEFDVQH